MAQVTKYLSKVGQSGSDITLELKSSNSGLGFFNQAESIPTMGSYGQFNICAGSTILYSCPSFSLPILDDDTSGVGDFPFTTPANYPTADRIVLDWSDLGDIIILLPQIGLGAGNHNLYTGFDNAWWYSDDRDWSGIWTAAGGSYLTYQTYEASTGYTLTYDTRGGSASVPPSRSNATVFTLPDNNASIIKVGHTLLGWSTTIGANTPNLTTGQSLSANIVAYAVWRANPVPSMSPLFIGAGF